MIALHSGPRIFFALLTRSYLLKTLTFERTQNKPFTNVHKQIEIQCCLGFVENFALLGLSIVPSVENFAIHKICFGGFILSSILNMCMTYNLMFMGYQQSTPGNQEYQNLKSVKTSLAFKRRILKTTLVVIPALIYFYWRHNTFCEPYIYSMFCFVEYIIVLMNISYHFSGYYLLFGMDVRITSQELMNKSSLV